jgi:hypothetical protein
MPNVREVLKRWAHGHAGPQARDKEYVIAPYWSTKAPSIPGAIVAPEFWK